jgi:two-component system heavy metal sensor histidine kinase CusS
MRTRFFGSLAWRLTAWYAISSFALIVVIAFISYYALLNAFAHEMDDYLSDAVTRLVTLLQQSGEAGLKAEIEQGLPSRQYIRTYARVLDQNGKIVTETRGFSKILAQDLFQEPTEISAVNNGRDIFSRPRRRTYRIASVKLPTEQKWTVQVACDRKREADILKRYKGHMWIMLSVSMILCAVGGYLIARRGIRPVSTIAETAGHIVLPTLHARIDLAGLPTEIEQLARAFNAMLERLEESFARLSQFSEDIAHELRTPVNNLRGGMEVVLGKPRSPEDYRDAIGSALEECERLARLVDRLLFIARSENSEIKIDRENVRVLEELARTREFYEATAEESGVEIEVNAGEKLSLTANRDLLRSLIGNLVSNALAHTPRGGKVTLSAASVDHSLAVTVADNGAGIPPEHLPHIFDRFYRVDRSRTKTSGGVGLGLAIVHTIAKLHGAKLDVASQVGKGTAITVAFPRD